MCGRFTLTEQNVGSVVEQLGLDYDMLFAGSYTPRWNVAPMQPFWIVTADQEERRVQPAAWGLVNEFDASRREGARHINARAASLASRRAYREAFAAGRCVIPADGFSSGRSRESSGSRRGSIVRIGASSGSQASTSQRACRGRSSPPKPSRSSPRRRTPPSPPSTTGCRRSWLTTRRSTGGCTRGRRPRRCSGCSSPSPRAISRRRQWGRA
ncbi:MAG: SOS response-associated peptidase [Chloroflexi bacterium]|nr:SOS response-associated peptidase [Chloroflexota bacterium]